MAIAILIIGAIFIAVLLAGFFRSFWRSRSSMQGDGDGISPVAPGAFIDHSAGAAHHGDSGGHGGGDGGGH
jgi:hypothetical protein